MGWGNVAASRKTNAGKHTHSDTCSRQSQEDFNETDFQLSLLIAVFESFIFMSLYYDKYGACVRMSLRQLQGDYSSLGNGMREETFNALSLSLT